MKTCIAIALLLAAGSLHAQDIPAAEDMIQNPLLYLDNCGDLFKGMSSPKLLAEIPPEEEEEKSP